MMDSLRLGIMYEILKPVERTSGLPSDAFSEYEPIETIELIERAAVKLGHRTKRLGGPLELLSNPRMISGIDAVFNIAEGLGSRNREAWAPILLEMHGVPCIGSDALTLSTSLDKHWTKLIVSQAGVPVVPGVAIQIGEECLPPFDFPLFVKPRFEGSAKGISRNSRVNSQVELNAAIANVHSNYGQDAVVEPFLDGAEYTVALIGNDSLEVFPVLQRAIDKVSGIGLHAVEEEVGPYADYGLSGYITATLEEKLARFTRKAFQALGCFDFARVDFRMGRQGEPLFLEINPLPTFSPDGTFGIISELEGLEVEDLVGMAIARGLKRLGFKE
jgi:D-alanine-D-alanine ligase